MKPAGAREARALPPAGAGELDAGGHGCIDLAVTVVMVGLERRDVGVHALQRVHEMLIGQLCDSPEARLVRVRGVEAAIGNERVQMDEQPQVVAEALHHDEDARVQGSAARQAVRALGEPPKRPHDPGREPLAHRAEQRPVIPKPHRQPSGKRKHPLPPGDRGQAMLDQQGGGLGHAPAHTRRADAAALAGKGDPQAVAAALALRDEEAVLEVATGEQRLEVITNERRQGTRTLFEAVTKRRPVFPHEGEGVAVLGAARDVLRLGVTAGHRRRRCVSRAGRSAESFRGLGRR